MMGGGVPVLVTQSFARRRIVPLRSDRPRRFFRGSKSQPPQLQGQLQLHEAPSGQFGGPGGFVSSAEYRDLPQDTT